MLPNKSQLKHLKAASVECRGYCKILKLRQVAALRNLPDHCAGCQGNVCAVVAVCNPNCASKFRLFSDHCAELRGLRSGRQLWGEGRKKRAGGARKERGF